MRYLRRVPAYYLKGLYQEFTEKNVFLWAQAIAFKVLITIVPVVILATGVLGQVLQREKPFETVESFVRDFLPAYQSDQLVSVLRQLQGSGDLFTIVGVAGLIFSAMTLFTTLRLVVASVFQEAWHKQRSIFGGYAFDLRMVGQVGLFFILTIGLSFIAQTFQAQSFQALREAGLDYVWVRWMWYQTIQILSVLVPLLLSTAMFFQLFFFVPKPRPPKRSAFTGAVVTGLLWEAAKSGFAIYASDIGSFERYGVREDADLTLAPALDAAGASTFAVPLGQLFGLIIFFVVWVYYSGIVLIVGALVTLLHEKRHRQRLARRQTPPEATRADEAPNGTPPEDPATPAEERAPRAAAPNGTLRQRERREA